MTIKRRIVNFTAFAGLILISLLPGLLLLYFAAWFVPYVLALLILGLTVNSCLHSRRLEKRIGFIAHTVVPGLAAEFQGIYSEGFEVGGIAVATGRRKFLIFPVIEGWKSRLPPGTELPPAEPEGSNEVRSYLMRFVGTPGKLGHYGHKGSYCREVKIEQVISVTPLMGS